MTNINNYAYDLVVLILSQIIKKYIHIYLVHIRYYKVNGKPVSYKSTLKYLNLPSLAKRREILSTKFAIQTFRNERYNNFFERKSYSRPNSRFKPIIHEPTCTTERYRKSATLHMTRTLNNANLDTPSTSP